MPAPGLGKANVVWLQLIQSFKTKSSCLFEVVRVKINREVSLCNLGCCVKITDFRLTSTKQVDFAQHWLSILSAKLLEKGQVLKILPCCSRA